MGRWRVFSSLSYSITSSEHQSTLTLRSSASDSLFAPRRCAVIDQRDEQACVTGSFRGAGSRL